MDDKASKSATEQPEPASWVLSPAEFEATRKRAEKINARAVRRGFTGRIAVAGTAREVTEKDEAGFPRTRVVIDTVIDGQAPRYNGWEFLAAVDTVATEAGDLFVLRCAPGVQASGVDRGLLRAGRCQHCNTVRPGRVHTFLVREVSSGNVRQVGSTCLKDFTGWEGRPVFVSVDDVADKLADPDRAHSAEPAAYTPATVVAVAWAASRRYGWVPASAAYGTRQPTRDVVSSYLYGTSRADQQLRADLAAEVTDAKAMVEGTIIPALLAGLDDGDYALNLAVCLRSSYVTPKHLGITVSAVAAYERLTGEKERRRAAAAASHAARDYVQYAGDPGQKLTISGTITRLLPVENTYGHTTTTSMLILIDAGRTVAKMFTAAAWAWDVEQGDEVTVTATVKAHEEYHGVRQTVLVRPKLARTSTPRTDA